MPPGNKIPTHKHLLEDEVIFVYGAVRVTLVGREYDAAATPRFVYRLKNHTERDYKIERGQGRVSLLSYTVPGAPRVTPVCNPTTLEQCS
jgi:hypothetical protein